MAGALAQDTRVPRAADDRRRRRRGRSFLAAGVHRGAAHTKEHWQQFGRFLARLHSTTQDHFGMDSNNYIGSLPQVNTPERYWPTFFLRHRLEPLVKAARDAHAMDGGTNLRSEQTYIRLGDLFPPGRPTLLHGDLRSGNFLCNADDRPVLFDPAVYFGQRERDIAMTKLFDGFDAAFYAAYNDERRLGKVGKNVWTCATCIRC